MMFGTREAFVYDVCGTCGSVQIAEVPADLDAHYPDDYYAYQGSQGIRSKFSDLTLSLRARHDLGPGSAAGRILSQRRGSASYSGAQGDQAKRWVTGLPKGYQSRILDVGCGNGRLLRQLRGAGFANVLGIDPYAAGDSVVGGVLILRKAAEEVASLGAFDLVMLHHVVEHLEDPETVFAQLADVVGPTGRLLVRIPVASTAVPRQYGAHWVQLDPPRHLWVPSEKGFRSLAERSGFTVNAVEYDSTAFQFWGSEQYTAGVPLTDPRSYAVDRAASMFSESKVDSFAEQARTLNVAGDGDQAAFFLSVAERGH